MLLTDDVVHLVRSPGIALIEAAILAAMTGPFRDEAAHGFRDCHRRLLRCARALAMIIRCSSCRNLPTQGVVDRNPAAALYTPRQYREGRAREVLTPEQAAIMIGALELREQVIARLATWEGMRPGEILALQLGDLDDDPVWVRRRVYRGDIDEPKTKRSNRRVALAVATLNLLEQWKLRLMGSPAETWLFGSENGTPLRRDNLWRRSFYPRLKAVGLEWATFQVMRRTFATLSKQAGIDAHTRSAQMGNTVDVNENEYAVATFEQKLAGVRKLESVVIQ